MASSISSRNKAIAMSTILTTTDLPAFIQKVKQKNQTIVLVGGCFDILHHGHIKFLHNAKQKGDILVVMLESDERIRKSKGLDRPIHSQQQRAEMIASIRFVDAVLALPFIPSNEGYDDIVKKIQPDIIATTEGDTGRAHKERQAQLFGAKLLTVNKLEKSVSTSHIIAALQKEL